MSNSPTGSRRLRVAAALLALVAVSVTGTWLAAGQVRSPAEAAARTLPPEPSPILVPVESRVLSSDIVTRGTGRYGSPQTLTIASTALKPTSGFVDTVPAVGVELHEGDVAAVLSGRPVIILQGVQPSFRDLGPGMVGSDVRQLEAALDRLGFWPGPIDGAYDEATELAVVHWYASLGHQPMTASVGQTTRIQSLQSDLRAIELEVATATESAAAARIELAAALETHRVAVAAARDAVNAVAGLRSEADAAILAAEAEAAEAELAAEQAWIRLPALFESPADEQAAQFELSGLRAAADAAHARAEAVRVSGTAAVGTAENVAATAPAEVAAAWAGVQAAQDRVAAADRITELAGLPASSVEVDLMAAQEAAGVQVPANEIIFVPEAPVRVAEVHVARGDVVDGPLVSVTDAVVAIDGSLALDQVALVEPGMQVLVSEPDLGISAIGEVHRVADRPGTNGVDGFHVYFETLVASSEAAIESIVGASVRLTLPVESSGGPVIAVPASALTLAADGSSQVLVDRGNASMDTVVVEPGLAASGYVAVTPISGELSTADLVVVGFEQRAAGS